MRLLTGRPQRYPWGGSASSSTSISSAGIIIILNILCLRFDVLLTFSDRLAPAK